MAIQNIGNKPDVRYDQVVERPKASDQKVETPELKAQEEVKAEAGERQPSGGESQEAELWKDLDPQAMLQSQPQAQAAPQARQDAPQPRQEAASGLDVSVDEVAEAARQASGLAPGVAAETPAAPQAPAESTEFAQPESANMLDDLDLEASGLSRRANYAAVDPGTRIIEEADEGTPPPRQRKARTAAAQFDKGSAHREEKKDAPDDGVGSKKDIVKELFPKVKKKVNEVVPGVRSRRTKDAEKKARERKPKATVSRKGYNGQGIYAKITGDAALDVNEISIGSLNIREGLSIPNSEMAAFLTEQTGVELTGDLDTDVMKIKLALDREFVEAGVFKSPNLEPESSCKMRIKVHSGRDLRMNPLSLKKFNADTDGDEACVSFDGGAINRCVDSMLYLLNLAGDLTLDPDFFPFYLSPTGFEASKEIKDATLEYIEQAITYNHYLAQMICDMYFSTGKERERRLAAVVQELYTTCKDGETGRVDTRALARLLSKTYRSLRDLRISQFGYGRDMLTNEELLAVMPAPASNADRRVYDFTAALLDEVTVRAEGAANFQDLRVMMHDYLGEPEGTNPSFRFTANIAKMFVNIDERVQVGGEVDVSYEELLEGTIKFVESRKISERLELGQKARQAKEILSERIIRQVGFLPDGNNTGDFLRAFIAAYKENAALINAANVKIMTDFGIEKKPGLTQLQTIGDIARVLRDVYGDIITVGMLVGNQGLDQPHYAGNKNAQTWTYARRRQILDVYGTWTLNKFAKDNKYWETDSKDNTLNKNLEDYAKQQGGLGVWTLIGALANMRTSTASIYNQEVYEKDQCVCHRILMIMHRMHEYYQTGVRSRLQSMQMELELLNVSDPDVYSYFGMDNINGFFNSKYGKALYKATTVEEVKTIRMAMTTEYRLSSVHRLITRLDESDYKDAAEAKQLVEDVRYEQELLASSSWVWSAVVKDSRQFAADDDSRPFQRFKQGSQDFLRTTYFKRWDSLGNYNTLEEVLLSLDLTKDEKCDIVADVVRYYEQFKSFISYQVPEQLEHNPNPVYSNVKPTSVGVMSATREFNKQYDRQLVKLENLSDEVGKAREIWGGTPGALTDAISFLADNKHSFCQINTDLLSDAMCAVLDKAYPQSEKSKQHVWTNAFYSAMSMARSGGFFSDVYRTDDRTVGLQSVEHVSPYDIVCVLSGQKRWCYDEQGQVFCLTRESLVGKDEVTEEDLWDFLQEYPLIASYIRLHTPTPIGDGCYMGAIGGIGETIGAVREGYADTAYDKALFELADDPRFAALVALVTPIRRKVSRDVKPLFKQNINRVIARIAYVRDNRDSYPDLASAFGVAQWNLEELGVEETEAEKMVGLVNASLEDFIRIIGQEDFAEIDRQKNHVDSDRPLGVYDLSACYAYYDIRQELSGSKTQVSTGIEGYETHNLTAFITALDLEDRYASLGEFDDLGYYTSDQMAERFGGCQTSLGKTVSQFDAEDWARFDRGEEIVIEMPSGEVRQDKSLGDDPRNQVPSVYSYLLVKRDSGAEKFNLKAKKTGDDGLHSVTKDGKYLTSGQLAKLAYENGVDGEPDSPASDDYGDLLSWLEGIYDSTPESMFEVKLSLAKRLLRANRMSRYDEVTLADCMNLADIMVTEADGGLRLRSISSVARSIKASFDYDLVRNGTKSEIHEAAVSAAAKAGTVTEDVSSVFAHLRPTSNAGRFSMMERPRSSSLEMNIAGLESLQEKNPGLEYADKAKHAMPIKNEEVSKAFKGILNLVGKGYFVAGYDNYAPKCIGPQALWVFTKYPDPEQFEQIVRQGVTALLPGSVSGYPNSVIVTYGDRVYQLLPGFDIAVNRSSYADSGFGTFRRPADNIVWMYEDTLNEHGLGDAGIQLFKSLVKRLKVNWKSTTDVPVSTMFANTFASYPDATFKVTLSSAEEVYKVLAADDDVDIDVGLAPSARGFEKHWDMTMAAIDRYVEKYRQREQDFYDGGLMLHGNRPGDVVAWMTCEVDDHEHKPFKVYAPVIPFDLTGHNEVSKAEVPSRFDLTKVSYNIDNVPSQSFFTFDWAYTDSLNKHALKFFEGQSAANKFYTSLNQVVDGFKFANGVDIDCCVAPESTASRRIGSNKRLGTMQSLVLMARTQGYNFAEDCNESFPGEQVFTNAQGEQEPIKERLAHGYMTISEWESIGIYRHADPKEAAVTFSSDPEFDHWIKRELVKYATNGGNPTDVLCCRFDGAHTDVWWDVECMLETSTKYQDGLMRFLNSMTAANSTPICAASTADHGEGYLFKCDDGKGFDSNCLKMQVPHRDPLTGGVYRSWENVYGGWSFFNFNDFTGAHRPNVNGYSDTLDAISTHALSGRTAKDEAYRAMLEAAMSEVGASDARPSFGVDVVRLGRPQAPQETESSIDEAGEIDDDRIQQL